MKIIFTNLVVLVCFFSNIERVSAVDPVVLPVDGAVSGSVSNDGSLNYRTLVKIPGLGQNIGGENVVVISSNSLGQYLQVGFNYFIGIAIALAVVMIIYGGVLYATTEAIYGKSEARNTIMSAVQGLALALSSWLILYTINPDLLKFQLDIGRLDLRGRSTAGGMGDVRRLTGLEVLQNGNMGGGDAGTSIGGSCRVSNNPNNPCNVVLLRQTCFADRAEIASSICMRESGGGATIPSGTDLLNSGRGPAYSYGVWQVNLTANTVRDPQTGRMLNCPSAFSGQCGSNRRNVGRSAGLREGNCTERVTNQALYDSCRRAIGDGRSSAEVACRLYNSPHPNSPSGRYGFNPWYNAANSNPGRCQSPRY